MTKRDASLDVTKAVAMFLVVFVHVRAYAPVPEAYRTPAWIENFCTLSALPLFLMISGLFSGRLFAELSVRRLALRTVACLWPVGTMIGVLGLLLRGALGLPAVSLGGLPSYLMSLGWFFFCLVLCETLTFAAAFVVHAAGCRVNALRRLVLAASLAGGYVVLWSLPVGMFHAVEMLPFYWFGVFLLPRLREGRTAAVVGGLSLAVFLAACCLAGDFRQVGLNFHLTSMNLPAFSGKGFLLMVGRIGLGLLGGFGLLTLVRLAVAGIPALGRLAGFGRQTMGIFFVHILLLAAYYGFGGWYGGGPGGRLALAVVVFFLSHCIVVLTKRSWLANALLWDPMSAWRAREGK